MPAAGVGLYPIRLLDAAAPEMGGKGKEGMQKKQGQAGHANVGRSWDRTTASVPKGPRPKWPYRHSGATTKVWPQWPSLEGPAPQGPSHQKLATCSHAEFLGGNTPEFPHVQAHASTQSQGVRGHYIMGEQCLERPLGHFSYNTP